MIWLSRAFWKACYANWVSWQIDGFDYGLYYYCDIFCSDYGVSYGENSYYKGSQAGGFPITLSFSDMHGVVINFLELCTSAKTTPWCCYCPGSFYPDTFVFANDSLLFCNAHLSDCYSLLTILRAYERASWQKINFDKSTACFSLNTDPMMQKLISNMLGVSIIPCHECYLGLPTVAQRSRSQMFKHVHDMLWNKLHGWSSKLLSLVGKELLIKSMA